MSRVARTVRSLQVGAPMRFVWATLTLVCGCMTDPNGETCAWSPGNDGHCPPEGGTSSGPVRHTYLSPHAAAEGDHLRIVMTGSESGQPPRTETTTLRPGEDATAIVPVTTLDGAELEAVTPQVSAIDDRVLLAWESATDQRAALLGPDGVLATAPVALGGSASGYVMLRRVGSRWLAIHVPISGEEIGGTWVNRDGAVDGTLTLATGVRSLVDVADDPTGTAPLGALVFFRLDGEAQELRVARFAVDGTRLDADSLLVARSIPRELSITSASVGTAADGSVLVIYASMDENFVREVRAVTIASDGTMVERTTPLDGAPKLLPGATNYFGLATRAEEATTNAFGQVLGLDGQPLGAASLVASTDYAWPVAVAAQQGYAVLHAESEVTVTFVGTDATSQGSAIVATSYEVDTGCHAGVSSGAGAMLALFGVRRRRKKYQSSIRVAQHIKKSV